MTARDYKKVYMVEYHKLASRVVRRMENEVNKLLRDHHELSIRTAWDIVTDAYLKVYKRG